MKLTGKQFSEFEEALLSAYPTTSNLTRLVRFKLEEHLTQIADGGNLTDVVFNLIIWAESKGRIDELITKSHDFNPENPQLKEFVSKYFASQADEPVADAPNSSVKPPPPSKKMTNREIRQALDKVDDVELDDLCLDYFPAVYDRFSSGMRRDRKITLLLDYCRRVEARKELLQKVLEKNRE